MKDAARRRGVLRRAEEALRRTLSNLEPEKKVVKVAEKFRAAKLSYIKGEREIWKYGLLGHEDEPRNSERKHLENLDSLEEEWKAKTIQEIINELE